MIERPSRDEVAEALAVLVRYGAEGVWRNDAAPLLSLPGVRTRHDATVDSEGAAALKDVLVQSLERVPSPQYRGLLRVVLGLDPEYADLPAKERRAVAGRMFRGGDSPVSAGTIRQHHEPKALAELAAVLVPHEAGTIERSDQRRAERDQARAAVAFGQPDASRGELEDFIEFEGADGLATRADDLRARVIVGRKGAGKTLYLRRARAYAGDSSDLYADDIQQNLPSTSDVVRIGNLYPHAVLVEKWMALWRCAILRSLTSHILGSRRLKYNLAAEEDLLLRESFPVALGRVTEARTPLSIYSQVTEMLQAPGLNARTLDQILAHHEWEALEYTLAELLPRYPPICMYMDAIDEEFRHAPNFWLMAQKGLFYQVLRLLRDSRLGGRFHIFICVRDHVYSSVFATEHATRYLDPWHIRVLEWDAGSTAYFLEQKVRRLDRVYVGDHGDRSVESWLGREEIVDGVRGSREPVQDYLLRHTRLLPRDVVSLGNGLCQKMRSRKGELRQLSDLEIRSVVQQHASLFGREQLEICANQISADMMPEHAALQGISEIYTGADPTFTGADTYRESIRQELTRFIRGIGRDRFDRAAFVRFRDDARRQFENQTDVMTVLWQSGLLGILPAGLKDGRAIFYSAAARHDLRIDDSAPAYAFHPTLIEGLSLATEPRGAPQIRPARADDL